MKPPLTWHTDYARQTKLGSSVGYFINFYLNVTIYVLYFTTRISIVMAVHFVIIDFKEMNE